MMVSFYLAAGGHACLAASGFRPSSLCSEWRSLQNGLELRFGPPTRGRVCVANGTHKHSDNVDEKAPTLEGRPSVTNLIFTKEAPLNDRASISQKDPDQ